MEIDYIDKKWSVYACLVISFIFFLLLFRWPLLPNFLDIYYHLLIARGFDKAAGFVTSDFLQYAPLGRPHLYPPFFHFVILSLMKLGFSPLFIGRLLDVCIFPLFLAVIWFFISSLFSKRLAFFAVLISASLYSFYLGTSNFMPVTVAFIFGLLSLLAQEKGKIISAILLLALSFYTHAQIPWLFVVVYIVYGALNRARFRSCLSVVLFSLLVSGPILLYLFKNRSFYRYACAGEHFVLEINLLLILSLGAFNKVFKDKGRYYLLFALAVSTLPFIFSYPYRYISGQGLLGLIFLASISADRIYAMANRFLVLHSLQQASSLLIILIIIIFTFFSPTLLITREKTWKFLPFNSTYLNLTALNKNAIRPNDYSIASSRYITELVRLIQKNTHNNDIIFTNLNFVGTMLAVLSDRADSKGMLSEVGLGIKPDPISNARLVIWFKNLDAPEDERLAEVISRYKLKKITETEIAYIYKNDLTNASISLRKADIPNKIIIGIMLLVSFLLAMDLFRLVSFFGS